MLWNRMHCTFSNEAIKKGEYPQILWYMIKEKIVIEFQFLIPFYPYRLIEYEEDDSLT